MVDSTLEFITHLRLLSSNEVIKSLELLVTSVSDDLLLKFKTVAEDELSLRKKCGNKRCFLSNDIQTKDHSNKKCKLEKEIDILDEFLDSPVDKDNLERRQQGQQSIDDFDDQFEMDSEEDRFAIFATSGISFSENGEVEYNGNSEILPSLIPLVNRDFSHKQSEIVSEEDLANKSVGFKKASGDIIMTKNLSKACLIFHDIDKDLEKITQVSI